MPVLAHSRALNVKGFVDWMDEIRRNGLIVSLGFDTVFVEDHEEVGLTWEDGNICCSHHHNVKVLGEEPSG